MVCGGARCHAIVCGGAGCHAMVCGGAGCYAMVCGGAGCEIFRAMDVNGDGQVAYAPLMPLTHLISMGTNMNAGADTRHRSQRSMHIDVYCHGLISVPASTATCT